MSALKPYPAYKNSGVPWLGEVPGHWEVRRLKQICRLTYGDALTTEVREQGTVPVYGSNGRVGFHSTANTKAPCIVIGRKGSFGKVNFSAEPVFAIDTTFFIDDRFSAVDLQWLFYLLGWLRLDEVSKDSAVPGLDREDAYQRVAAVPPLFEQSAIVRFLDHVDRRIHRHIRAKQKLIKLLEEQKQAIIYRAVTRGFDPNVRLKLSGVEWLGEVPEHWEILKIRYFARVGNGSTPSRGRPDYWTDGQFPWLNSSVVNRPIVESANQFVTSTALKECHLPTLRPGVVLVAITGQGKTRGKAAMLSIDATINQHLAYIEIRQPMILPEFLQAMLTAAYTHLRSISDDSGSTKGALTCADLRHFKVAIPPKEEQIGILEKLKAQLATTHQAIMGAEKEISLLREYRTRLIADVVTGKLDVREAAANLPQEIPETPEDTELSEMDEEDIADSELDAEISEAAAE